jgi:hypothetical protein
METLTAVWAALIAEPPAFVPIFVAVVFTLAALNRENRIGGRLLALALAVISGMTAWMMASRFRW